jgi:hypothetical protein
MAGVAVTDRTLALAGVEVRYALDWFELSADDRLKVLAAEMARITVETPVQDKWPAPAQNSVNLVYSYILAARRKAAVAEATPHGSALCWLRRHL